MNLTFRMLQHTSSEVTVWKITDKFKRKVKDCHTSAIADHITSTGHNIKWDHFDILATGRSDLYCKIKETLLIRELQPALNENGRSEQRFLY